MDDLKRLSIFDFLEKCLELGYGEFSVSSEPIAKEPICIRGDSF